jgi:hypothetical protein
MIAIALVFSVLFVCLSLVVGVLVGWTLNQHLSQREPYTYHPEMFDENGNVLADELIAFRFENTEHMEEEEDLED